MSPDYLPLPVGDDGCHQIGVSVLLSDISKRDFSHWATLNINHQSCSGCVTKNDIGQWLLGEAEKQLAS